jgi:hypothetical protein
MKRSRSLILVFLSIVLVPSAITSPQADSVGRLIDKRLRSLSSTNGGETVDCGSTTMNKPERKVSLCAETAFKHHKPFRVLYSSPGGFSESAYGLAGDAVGNVYELEYDSRGLLHLGLGRKSQVFDGNHIRVTTCIKPIRLGSTEQGMLACITPVNRPESQLAALQKPIETTVCAILQHPAAFNNKMVRIHGHASGNFEYSNLGADGCSDELWFEYGNGDGPPGLVAILPGGARPGAEDAEGRRILPIPVKLVADSSFRRFQELMKTRAEEDERTFKENTTTFTEHRVAATFIGRIDGVSDDIHAFHLKRKETDKVDFLGFGQMGLFDAQFVLQSVENDAVLETLPPVPNPLHNEPPKS